MNKLKKEVDQWLKEKYNMSDFNAYQRSAIKTAVYPPEHRILYPALGLAGEAGEVANKVKKVMRDGIENQPNDWKDQIASEIGDVLWYCAALANDLNMPLAMIANLNEKKLRDRFDRGKINGSGDNR